VVSTEVDKTSEIWNEDLAPTDPRHRTWTWLHYVTLWIGMVVCIPGYIAASSLLDQGMSAIQAVVTVFLGNLIVVVPIMLVGHAGAKYGIPFAVLVRSSFGVRGNKLPALLRAIVACGWFGIQCWIGGNAIHVIGNILLGGTLTGPKIPFIGLNVAQLGSFFLFWALHLYFIKKGPESVRWIETFTAPIKILIVLALLVWAYDKAGGFGEFINAPSHFVSGGKKEGQFWSVFAPALTAMIGIWATLALNIPDFTRFARSQKDQMLGQAIGLPAPMALFSLVGVAVTSATVVIYGKAIWDPVDLAGRMEGIAVAIGLAIITIDTLCVNLAANVVGPAYDFAAIFPRHVNFARGGYITAVLGVVMMPWKLIESSEGYIFTWLIGYGALLGPVLGIMLADYWLVRRRQLDVPALFDLGGRYAYRGGWNPAAVTALGLGVLPNVPGFLHAAFPKWVSDVGFFADIYDYALIVGLAVALSVYTALMRGERARISEALPLSASR
jgi:NCS1 family nucleobase:cation symporter-1